MTVREFLDSVGVNEVYRIKCNGNPYGNGR